MKVCFFGSFNPDYSRNIVLTKGLKKIRVPFEICTHPNYFSLNHYTSLFKQFLKKARDCDIIFVGIFGHYDVIYAWLLAKLFKKKLIFDPLISIYNTRIEDRKYFPRKSFRAILYKMMDRVNIYLSDRVIIDTNAHFEYFHKNFGLKEKKMSIVRVGADESTLLPRKISKKNKKFSVLFYGSYQPSQGSLKIVQAAKILRDNEIEWILIGDGQDRPKVENYVEREKLEKVSFLPFMKFDKLVKYINRADVLLGIFGNTIKSNMVVHNKIYQAIAMGKVLITQDTPAVREVLKNDYDAILITPDPKVMAEAIISLIKTPALISRISKSARKTFLNNFTTTSIGIQAREAFSKVINTS